MASEEEILEENRRVRRLQVVAGLVMNLLRQSDLPVEEAAELVAATRQYALSLFPDKAHVYDMIYEARFKRLMAEKYKLM